MAVRVSPRPVLWMNPSLAEMGGGSGKIQSLLLSRARTERTEDQGDIFDATEPIWDEIATARPVRLPGRRHRTGCAGAPPTMI